MEQERTIWAKWEGKKAYLILRSGRRYTGQIKKVDESDKPIIFLHLIDKFGLDIIVSSSEISEIREVKE
jgi:hypothetical protein